MEQNFDFGEFLSQVDWPSSSVLRAHAREFSPYHERGIVNDLRSGSGKSRQR